MITDSEMDQVFCLGAPLSLLFKDLGTIQVTVVLLYLCYIILDIDSDLK